MRMPEYTKDEALAFIESMRLTIAGRVGFKWLGEKLSDLAVYIESIAAENERLNAYVDCAHARGDYESYCEKHSDKAAGGAAPEED